MTTDTLAQVIDAPADPYRDPVVPEGAQLWDPQDNFYTARDFEPIRPPRRKHEDSAWEFHGVIHSIGARRAGEDTCDGERDGGKQGDRGWVFTGSNGFGSPQHLFVSAEAARALGRMLLGLDPLPEDSASIFVTSERN